ncbi:hypothetical protein SDC9_208826 [bioreactor metagenome]|uniref:Uncharacterized protein n=1 Tax=bioreactor metagenome TaxID=1076179 RepID=A0A645JD47_9ZZZZ
MLDMQYELPDKSSGIKRLTVTKDVVKGLEKPVQSSKDEKEAV